MCNNYIYSNRLYTMEFLINNIGHILSIIGLVVTLYTFYKVRRAKFILIKKEEKLLIDNVNGYDLKYENILVTKKLFYNNIILCYLGAKDTKKDEIEVPLTIQSIDENLNFIDFKVIKTTANFNPRVILRDKKIQIVNNSFHNGDVINLEILTESDNNSIYINKRFLNVKSTTDNFIDNKNNITSMVTSILLIFFFSILSYYTVDNYQDYENNVKYFNTKYYYKGYLVSEDRNYISGRIADSIFFEEPSVKKILTKDTFYNNDDYEKHIKTRDSIMLFKPSILSEKKIKELTQKNELEMDKVYKISNELKISVNNPYAKTLLRKITDIGLFCLLFVCLIISLISLINSIINIRYVTIVRNFIKKG